MNSLSQYQKVILAKQLAITHFDFFSTSIISYFLNWKFQIGNFKFYKVRFSHVQWLNTNLPVCFN